MVIHFVNSVSLILEKIGTVEILPVTLEHNLCYIRLFLDDISAIKITVFQFVKSKVYYCPLCNKKQTKAIDQLPRNWTIEAAVQKLEELGPAPVVPAKQFCQIHPNMEVSLGQYQIDTISDLELHDHH